MENHLTYNMSSSTYSPTPPMTSTSIRAADILGTAEVAALLECPKQQIHTLRKRSDFPIPVATIAATPLWDRNDIITFKTTWVRRKKSS
jgi:hypothetical protein